MGKSRKLTDDQRADIRVQYEAGVPVRSLALEHGCAQGTIERAVVVSGGTLRGKRQASFTTRAITSCGPVPKPRVGHGKEGYQKVRIELDDPMIAMAQKRIANHQLPYVLEHRLVLARKIGRPLTQEETVHHINGDTSDNRPENLELRVGRHGKGATAAHCATCSCFDASG